MKMLREPLLHFLVAGALLFSAHSWLNPSLPNRPAEDSVRIGPGELRWLSETFASQWRRQPTPEEMNGLLATLVEEELLSREARALRLDENDTIVRRRLAQKLAFLVDDTSRMVEPTEEDLRSYYGANTSRYRSEPKLSFEQVFFSTQRRPEAAADAAATLLLIADAGPKEGTERGDPLPVERSFEGLDARDASAVFGPEFTKAAFALPVGAWSGPVPSAFGLHLVRITGKAAGMVRSFDEVREALAGDVRRARESETRQAYLRKLRSKYGVVIEDEPGQDVKATAQ